MGEIFMKSKKFCKFFEHLKEGGNGKYLGSIVIRKARGVWKSLFCVSAPKGTEDMNVSLTCVGQVVTSCFCPCPGCRKGLEDKTYPTMDLPVHVESDGVSCISVKDYICKLLLFD